MSGSQSASSQFANLLSIARLMVAPVWIAIFARSSSSELLGALTIGAALTDFIDGRVARALGSTSQFGRWLDGIADVIFVLAVLGCWAWAGAIPAYIPILIAASFSQYAIDSAILSPAAIPVRSRLGHWGGIINYALAIALTFAPPPSQIAATIAASAPLIAAFYLAAIAERAILLYRRR